MNPGDRVNVVYYGRIYSGIIRKVYKRVLVEFSTKERTLERWIVPGEISHYRNGVPVHRVELVNRPR